MELIYPSKSELSDVLECGHQAITDAFQTATEKILGRPLLREHEIAFPTVLDDVAFEMTNHEALHLGQLSAWRRAMGMGRA